MEYIDSVGVAALAKFAKNVAAKNGALALCCLSPKLGSIFCIMKLGKVFRIYDTQEQALAAI